MAKSDLIDIEVLCQLVDYDAETGVLSWRFRPRDMFSTEGSWKAWNSRCSGKIARCAKNGGGYFQVSLWGKLYLNHRVIWAITNGEWPEGEIDHINGVRTDNRIDNLRDVSKYENQHNAAMRLDNSSSCTGISFRKDVGKYRSRIMVNGGNVNLGLFDSIDDAIAARKTAERKFGFHENHGRNRG